MGNLNILHALSMSKIGGIESRLMDYFAQPDPRYSSYLFSTTLIPHHWRQSMQQLKIPFFQASNKSTWINELIDVIQFLSVDIVHFHQPLTDAMITLKERKLCKVIYHDHGAAWYGSDEDIKKRWTFIPWIDGVLAVSNASRTMLQNRMRCPENKIQVIHNGVDFTKLASQSPIPHPKHRRIITSICRLTPYKGVSALIRAVPHVIQREKNVEFWIIGDGPSFPELESTVKKLGVEKIIKFFGRQSNIGDYLRAADLFVLPSYREPFAGVLIEAAYVGLPIVAANVDGNPEIIRHNKTGFLIQPVLPVHIRNIQHFPRLVIDGQTKKPRKPLALDPKILSSFILYALNNPERCHEMGLQAKQSVLDFNVHRYREELVSYYLDIMSGTVL